MGHVGPRPGRGQGSRGELARLERRGGRLPGRLRGPGLRDRRAAPHGEAGPGVGDAPGVGRSRKAATPCLRRGVPASPRPHEPRGAAPRSRFHRRNRVHPAPRGLGGAASPQVAHRPGRRSLGRSRVGRQRQRSPPADRAGRRHRGRLRRAPGHGRRFRGLASRTGPVAARGVAAARRGHGRLPASESAGGSGLAPRRFGRHASARDRGPGLEAAQLLRPVQPARAGGQPRPPPGTHARRRGRGGALFRFRSPRPRGGVLRAGVSRSRRLRFRPLPDRQPQTSAGQRDRVDPSEPSHRDPLPRPRGHLAPGGGRLGRAASPSPPLARRRPPPLRARELACPSSSRDGPRPLPWTARSRRPTSTTCPDMRCGAWPAPSALAIVGRSGRASTTSPTGRTKPTSASPARSEGSGSGCRGSAPDSIQLVKRLSTPSRLGLGRRPGPARVSLDKPD